MSGVCDHGERHDERGYLKFLPDPYTRVVLERPQGDGQRDGWDAAMEPDHAKVAHAILGPPLPREPKKMAIANLEILAKRIPYRGNV